MTTSISQMKYSVSRPSVTSYEVDAVINTLCQGQLTQGNGVAQFEERFAERIGARYAVMCSSGTAALHLALLSLGVKAGDEVLVPDLTYVAVANAVRYVGATPVLVDVDLQTWGLDLQKAEQLISSRTRAIIIVHLYGVPFDMTAAQAFANRHELLLIEDAAEALGADCEGAACGTRGNCGTFSFYGNKILTTGEGGAVVTDNYSLATRARFFRGQAQSLFQRFYHTAVGYNYRMTDIHAAIGLAQLGRIDSLLRHRHLVIASYRERLHAFQSPVTEKAAPWLYTLRLPQGVSYHVVEDHLRDKDIEVRPVFVPMHRLPMYELPDEQFPVSTEIAASGVSLPTHPDLRHADVEYISSSFLAAVGNA